MQIIISNNWTLFFFIFIELCLGTFVIDVFFFIYFILQDGCGFISIERMLIYTEYFSAEELIWLNVLISETIKLKNFVLPIPTQ